MVSCFLLLVAVSSTFRYFKPYLLCEIGTERTDRRKVTVMHKTSRRTGTGTGTARRGTAQDSTREQKKTGRHRNDIDIQSTARQSHCVNTIRDHRFFEKKKNTERRGSRMRLPPLDTQYAFLPFSFLKSLIPTFFSILCTTRTP